MTHRLLLALTLLGVSACRTAPATDPATDAPAPPPGPTRATTSPPEQPPQPFKIAGGNPAASPPVMSTAGPTAGTGAHEGREPQPPAPADPPPDLQGVPHSANARDGQVRSALQEVTTLLTQRQGGDLDAAQRERLAAARALLDDAGEALDRGDIDGASQLIDKARTIGTDLPGGSRH